MRGVYAAPAGTGAGMTGGSEWKYVDARRLALFIEESIARDTQWVVFEPNDERLWTQIRLRTAEFLHSLFKQGAFVGETPRDAYFVKCGRDTMTQEDVENGIVNILVGFASLRPAEFVILRIQQHVGHTQSDPYARFKFRLKWDGRYVAGFTEVSLLSGTSGVVEHRARNDPGASVKLPGLHKHEALMLARGATYDRDFEVWASSGWQSGSKDVRKDIVLETYDEAGRLVLAYNVFRCWVSEFVGLPDLDASANAVAIQRITLENEGLER